MRLATIDLAIYPPPTHQAALRILKNKATGKMFVGKMQKSSAKKWCVEAEMLMRQARKAQAVDTIQDAVTVSVCFNYAHTEDSKRRAKRLNLPFVPKRTRPDLDNLAKSTLDALVAAGWLADDNQIVELQLSKRHSEFEGLTIDILTYPIQG